MKAQYCLDTNIFITAWNIHYPPVVFPSLWEQLAEQSKQLVVIEPVLHELKGTVDDDAIFVWARSQSFIIEKLTTEMELTALEMEKDYQIKQNSTGVNSVDIRLITYAKHANRPIVTYERRQPHLPKNKSLYKIPAVCRREDIPCIDLVELFKSLEIIV